MKYILILALLTLPTLAACDRKPPASTTPSTSSAALEVAGSKEDPVYRMTQDDAAMDNAIQHARKTVDKFKVALANPGSKKHFGIKGAFTDGKNTEYMWLNAVTYRGGFFKGKIGNDPTKISDYKFAQEVTVKDSEISDWMYIEDNKLVGGFTLRVLVNAMTPDDRKSFFKSFPFAIEEEPTSAK